MFNQHLKNALYNLYPRSGSTPGYAEGLLVGVVATLMSNNISFRNALKTAVDNCPNVIMDNAIPQAWKDDFNKIWESKTVVSSS